MLGALRHKMRQRGFLRMGQGVRPKGAAALHWGREGWTAARIAQGKEQQRGGKRAAADPAVCTGKFLLAVQAAGEGCSGWLVVHVGCEEFRCGLLLP